MDVPSSISLSLADLTDDALAIGAGAHVTLVGEVNSDRTLDIRLEENAQLTTGIVHRAGTLTQTCTARKNARMYSNVLYFGSGESRVSHLLEGDGAEAYDVEIFVMDGTAKRVTKTLLQHTGKNTGGNILVKGIAKDKSSIKIDGMIRIEKAASGTNSFLDQHVLLLNPGARAETQPKLEIENNDVQSSHSASVGQISEEKLFYLESRGLPRGEARMLLVHGFLASAVQKIPDAGFRANIELLLSTVL